MMLRALSRRWINVALLTALAAALIGMLVTAPGAFADPFTPESGGSQQAEDIDSLYKITLYIGIVIFVGVEAVLLYSLIKYRARRGGPEAQQIHGNTPLEIGWTVGAALILVVLTVVTFVYLPDIVNPAPSGPNGLRAEQARFGSIVQPAPPKSGGPVLTIDVVGQQYLWRYDYAGGDQLFAYYEMVVPTDTTVVLHVTGTDVIHSWWIPKLGGKVDGVPGHENDTWFKIPAGKEGIYQGQCAELCGAGHADMRARVRAVTPDEFEDWARRTRQDIQAAGEDLAEQRKRRAAEQEGEDQ
jgi:cytochrome c oxidase subunit 2